MAILLSCHAYHVLVNPETNRVQQLPVTHSLPSDAVPAAEIPQATKARLGPDAARAWKMVSERNEFILPGPGLRPAINGI